MARYPGATWRPIDTKYLPNRHMTAYNRVNLHVAVSEASSIHSVFNRLGAASSHFYVRKNGTVEQYIDTAYQAEADLEGNDATISIETQGGVHDPDNEPWTNEQIEALAQIYAWAVKTHGIPLQVASTSKTDNTSRGLSWHRLGIDGNFPTLPNPGAGRLQRGGGMHYSKSRGKLCPGLGKIVQIPSIHARAQALLNNTPAPAPEPVPDVQEDEMILIRNSANGAVVLVLGGVGSSVLGADYAAYQAAGVPVAGVTPEGFDIVVERYMNR